MTAKTKQGQTPAPEVSLAEAAAVWEPIENLRPWDKNPRANDKAIPEIAKSIRRFGFASPIVANKRTGEVIAGHTRLAAAQRLGLKQVPVRWMDLDPGDAHALALADNRTGEIASWRNDVLADVMRTLKAQDEALLVDTGFSPEEIAKLLAGTAAGSSGGGGRDPSTVADPGATTAKDGPADSKLGVVYQLGPHRLLCGDSTDLRLVTELCGADLRTSLVHADPPYGMGKEADGVENDNLYKDKLDQFQMAWWRTWRRFLADNGAAYVWGVADDLWRLWYRPDGLAASERLTMRNEIVWDKGNAMGMRSEGHRQYATATERCLFFMLGDQGFGNVNKDDYWEGFEPLRTYLEGEAQRMGWGAGDVKRICGVGMYGHWFTKCQWTMIPRDRYQQLQDAAAGHAFTRPYGELRAIYDGTGGTDAIPAKQEHLARRAYFDNVHDAMTDVWRFDRVQGEERHGHATPKPVAMVERAIKSSSRPGDVVLEPFGGSGSTLIAAARTERVCYTAEITPSWCDVIRRRWTAWAKAAGVDPGPGALV